MKKTLTTEKALALYNIIGSAKLGKMNDADKIKVWKAARMLKPVAVKFDEDAKDAAEKMKPSEDYDEKLRNAQMYEMAKKAGKPTEDIMSDEDYKAFIEEFVGYQKLLGDAVREFAVKEVEVEFDPITEDGFALLLAANEWDMSATMAVDEFIVEQIDPTDNRLE